MKNVWTFPLLDWHLDELPNKNEPGSFGFRRKYDIHTGVDLYTKKGSSVVACETGLVIAIEEYTGPSAGSPWWLPTKSILIEGKSGVICYGEIFPINISKGDIILKGQTIGSVLQVLNKNSNPNIKNHSNCMLHFELYKKNTKNSVWWNLNECKPNNLLDPTKKLYDALKNKLK